MRFTRCAVVRTTEWRQVPIRGADQRMNVQALGVRVVRYSIHPMPSSGGPRTAAPKVRHEKLHSVSYRSDLAVQPECNPRFVVGLLGLEAAARHQVQQADHVSAPQVDLAPCCHGALSIR